MAAGADPHMVRALLDAVAVLDSKGFFPATDGNVSLRAGAGGMLITRSGIEKRRMTEGDLLACDFNAPAEGISSEWRLHRALYRSRGDVHCILHAHCPHLTAFAAARRAPSATLLAETAAATGEIVFVPYAEPGTEALGAALIEHGPRAAVYILANHGAVAVGPDPRTARHRLERAEFAAQVEILAAAIGGGTPLRGDTPEQSGTAGRS